MQDLGNKSLSYNNYNYIYKYVNFYFITFKISKSEFNNTNDQKEKKGFNNRSGKWCRKHRNNSHNTADCFMNKSGNNKSKDKDSLSRRDDTNVTMKEAREDVSVIEIRGYSNECNFNFIMDSGASRDYISEKLVNMLNLKKCQNKPINVIIGDNSEITCDETVSLEFITKENGNKKYLVEPYVLKNAAYDLILGNKFMFGYNCKIDYRDKVVIIDNETIKIQGCEDFKMDELDRMLIEKLCVSQDTKLNKNVELYNMLCLYKKKNRELREMKISPIILRIRKNNEVIQSKGLSCLPRQNITKN